MAIGDTKSQSLTKIQIFVVSGHDFQTTTNIRRTKFTFSCIIQAKFSENEKRNTSTIFLTHIFALKVAISFSESLFALKGPKFEPQYLGNELEFWEKIFPNANFHHLVQNNWKQRKFQNITSRLYLILPGFLRKWLLLAKKLDKEKYFSLS